MAKKARNATSADGRFGAMRPRWVRETLVHCNYVRVVVDA